MMKTNLVLIIIFLAARPVTAQNLESEIMPSVSMKMNQIDTADIADIVRAEIRDNYFEGTICIADRGEVIYQKSSGFANRELGIQNSDSTKFGIASITKMITAILILQLVEEGQMSLDNTLAELLPDYAVPNNDQITVHHLLLHISGLPKESEFIYSKRTDPDEFIKIAINDNLEAAKFGDFNYTNIDYVLLGLIIEAKTGLPWRTVVTERIINKLELENTGFLTLGSFPDNLALTYQVSDDGAFTRDPEFHIENFYAAACMYSTSADLLKIDQAMYGDVLLSERSKELMFTSYPKYNYTGYSVWTYNYPFAETKPLIMERRGGILGSNSVILRMMDTNRTIIILSNNSRFNADTFGDLKNIREALMIVLGKKES